jgi:hypothetical protein
MIPRGGREKRGGREERSREGKGREEEGGSRRGEKGREGKGRKETQLILVACTPIENCASSVTCTTPDDSKCDTCLPGYKKLDNADNDACIGREGGGRKNRGSKEDGSKEEGQGFKGVERKDGGREEGRRKNGSERIGRQQGGREQGERAARTKVQRRGKTGWKGGWKGGRDREKGLLCSPHQLHNGRVGHVDPMLHVQGRDPNEDKVHFCLQPGPASVLFVPFVGTKIMWIPVW